MGDDQKQDKFKDLGGTFRLDTTVPQASSTEGAPAQVRQPIPAPAQSPNKVDEIREATNPDEAAKRIGQGFESTVTGGLKMLGDIVLPPGKTEGERLKYLGKKYVTDPLNTAAAAALKQGPGIGQVATVGEALPGVGPMAVAPVVEGVRAASKSPTAALETAQTTAGVAGALALAEPAMKGLKGASEGAVSGLGETAQTFGGAAGEEVGNMARATAPEGSTEAGRVKLNVKGKAEPAKAAIPEPVGVHHDDLPYQAKYQDVDFSARDLQDSEKKVTAETVRKDYASGNKTASIYQSYIPMEDLPTGSVEEDFDREDYLRPRTGAPIKVQVAPDGQLEILDGNHRAIMWDEQGKQYAPAWVVDYRHPDIENLSEDEKAERTEMEAEPAATEPTIEHEPIGRQGGLVTLKDNGKEVGRVRYTIPQEERPASASVTAANLEPEYRGKGYGQKLYLRAADELRQQGIPAMTSDLKGSTTMDAARVWDKLAEKGHPIEQIESTKAGSPAYKWDLTKPQVAPKAIDFSEIGGKTVKSPMEVSGTQNLEAFPQLPAEEQHLQQRQKEIEAGINPTNELPIPSAYQKLFGYPETKYAAAQKGAGYTWQNVRAHEAGHAIVADAKGFAVGEMGAAEPNRGNLASMDVNYGKGSNPIPNVRSVPGKPGVYHISSDDMAPRIKDMLSTLMAGGVAQEEFHGIP